jgi:hypothetical protein
MNITKCIQKIYPSAQMEVDFVAQDNGSGPFIARWDYEQPQPTSQQLSAAWQQVLADEAAASAKRIFAENLKTAYSNFSDGGKAAFGGIYDAVVSHISRGDVGAAKIAVQMVDLPEQVPGVPAAELATWVAIKAEILSLFP